MTARPHDTGERDALGRPIKVSAAAVEQRPTAPPPPGAGMVTDDDLRWEAERANLQPWSTLVLLVDDHGTTGSETIVGPDQGRTLRHQLEHVGLGAARLRTITRRINGSYECGHWPPTPNAARLALDEQIRRCVFIDGHNDQSRQRVRDAFDTLCLASGVPDPAAAMNEAYEKIVNAEVARLHAETAAGSSSPKRTAPPGTGCQWTPKPAGRSAGDEGWPRAAPSARRSSNEPTTPV